MMKGLCPGCPWWCEFEAWCREDEWIARSERIVAALDEIDAKLEAFRAERQQEG